MTHGRDGLLLGPGCLCVFHFCSIRRSRSLFKVQDFLPPCSGMPEDAVSRLAEGRCAATSPPFPNHAFPNTFFVSALAVARPHRTCPFSSSMSLRQLKPTTKPSPSIPARDDASQGWEGTTPLAAMWSSQSYTLFLTQRTRS